MRVTTKSCYDTIMVPSQMLVYVSRIQHRVLDPADVYQMEANGGETEIRLRSRTPLVDARPIGEVAPLFELFEFIRIHREHSVNLTRVQTLRLQAEGRDWELKLEPPVNRVIPVARDWLDHLRSALGAPVVR